MALEKEDVQGLADYARIALDDEELDEMWHYLNSAIELLEPIREFDLDGVEPTFHPVGSLVNVMGDDCPDDGTRALSTSVALSASASHEGRNFTVPSILGEAGGEHS